jgi:DNA-binding NarL/FixJ family response regulator
MRAVIAEDLALLRAGLERLLTAHDIEVVRTVSDGPSLVEAVLELRPDVAVVDVRMPPSFTDEGLRAAIEARRHVEGLGVLVLSQYVEPGYAAELLADGHGGVGYLLKERVGDTREFVDAVRRVAAGGAALDPEVVAQFVALEHRGPLQDLTVREHEVLGLMAEGRSNVAIANALTVTAGAVEKHVTAIFGKLGLDVADSDNRRVLAVLAYLRAREST